MLKKIKPTASLANLPRQNALDTLLRELSERERLLNIVKPLLPQDLRSHCSQASTDGHCLLLFADSPVWATKLRLFAQNLLRVLTERGIILEQCQVRVSPPLATANVSTASFSAQGESQDQSPMCISEATAEHLEQAARSMSDARLAACFQRIANRHYSRG